MAHRNEKNAINGGREGITIADSTRDQHAGGPDRSHLARTKGVVVHHRTMEHPDRFVPKLAVKPGVSVLDLLHGDDEAVSECGAGK